MIDDLRHTNAATELCRVQLTPFQPLVAPQALASSGQ